MARIRFDSRNTSNPTPPGLVSGTTVLVEADPERIDAFCERSAGLGRRGSGARLRDRLRHLFRGIELAGRRVLDIGGRDGMHGFYAALMGAREVVCLEPDAADAASAASRGFASLKAAEPTVPVRLDPRTIRQFRDEEPFDVVLLMGTIARVDPPAARRVLVDPVARATYRAVFAHLAMLTRSGAKVLVADRVRGGVAPHTWATLFEEVGFGNASLRWVPLQAPGGLARRLLASPAAAYVLGGPYRLELERTPLGPTRSAGIPAA